MKKFPFKTLKGVLILLGSAIVLVPQTFAIQSEQDDEDAEVTNTCDGSDYVKWFPEEKGEQMVSAIFCRLGYAASFNPNTRNPDWVVEILNVENLKGTAKRKDNFKQDPELKAAKDPARAKTSDYHKSGFDMGHQAPAGDMKKTQPKMNESFYLTNMAPQTGIGFNRGVWRNLEDVVRVWANNRPESNLVIITGPVYDPEADKKFLKDTPVRVPDAFYKIIYDTRSRKTIAFLMPNEVAEFEDYKDHIVSIREVEDKTGYDFFSHWSTRYSTVKETNKSNLWR